MEETNIKETRPLRETAVYDLKDRNVKLKISIKTFEKGVVSYNLFEELFEEQATLIRRLKHLVDLGEESHTWRTTLDLIGLLINFAEKNLEEFGDKGFKEKEAAGGRYVSTVKSIKK